MKKLFFLLSVAMLLIGGCCGNNCNAEELINYVPADADGVVSVDSARLINLSHLKDFRKDDKNFDKSWNEFEAELAKFGLKPSDLPSQMMIFFKAEGDMEEAGILGLTDITEAKLLKIFDANKDKVSYTAKTIEGRKAYIVSRKMMEDDKAVITYIKPNLVLVCDEEKAGEMFKSVGKSTNKALIGLKAKADPKALITVLYEKEVKAAQPAQMTPMGPNPMDSLKSAVLALNLSGKAQRDINLKGDVVCKDATAATQLAGQLKTLVMVMSMQMAQNPELSKMFTEAIKVEQKNDNVKLSISISEKLLNDTKAFIKQRSASMGAAPMQAAPIAPVAPVKAAK